MRMGIMKRMQLEQAEAEYAKHLAELKEEADALYPEDDWDPEDYEAWKWAMEKDD